MTDVNVLFVQMTMTRYALNRADIEVGNNMVWCENCFAI